MTKELQDLAWRVLPAEFREEVKKLYTDALDASNSPHEPDDRKWGNYRVTLLENLFGHHNLTSDAEGEEMLTAPRKKVQEVYTQNQNEIIRENVSSSDKDCYETVNEVLKTLFGSKCLPDNVDSSEPNVDSLKPKPAEADTSHETPVCENHSDNTSQKEVNVNSNRNLSKDCDKHFDNVLKNSFSKERRLNIAAMAMQGILSNPVSAKSVMVPGNMEISELTLAEKAVKIADALIAECDKLHLRREAKAHTSCIGGRGRDRTYSMSVDENITKIKKSI